MKKFFTNIILFIAFSIAFSSLMGCPSANNENNSVSVSNANTSANTNTTEKKREENSIAAPAAMMQADIKLLDGATFKLADKKGKVVLVNLWATWCGPCRDEMPALVEMQEKYKNKNFEIIGLDVDPEGEQEIKNFAVKMNLNYQLGWADDSFLNEFHKVTKAEVIPQTILFNRDGNMTAIFIGGGAKNINKMRESVEKTVNE